MLLKSMTQDQIGAWKTTWDLGTFRFPRERVKSQKAAEPGPESQKHLVAFSENI